MTDADILTDDPAIRSDASETPPRGRRPRKARKWLGPWGGLVILAGFAVVWLYLLCFDSFVLKSQGVSLTALVLGGFALASAVLYAIAYRVRPEDGLSVSRLLLAFLVGGVIATVLAQAGDWFTNVLGGAHYPSPLPGLPVGPTGLSSALAGVVEEFVKVFMVFIISIRLANRSPRNALFIGGAVGLGFGAIEDMSYELRAWDYPDYLHHVTPLWSIVKLTGERDLFGWLHPTFTALLAVALFAMMRQPRVKTILAFVGLYLLLAAAHGLYDYIDFVNFGHLSASTMANVLLVIRGVINIGGIVAWFLVARRNRIRPASGIVTPDVALT